MNYGDDISLQPYLSIGSSDTSIAQNNTFFAESPLCIDCVLANEIDNLPTPGINIQNQAQVQPHLQVTS